MNSNINYEYDMIIIGGGATGSGIALDASSRGHKVLLLEKDDFASGTSSKSSKLIHGGVRYLEKAIKQMDREQFNLVKEGLKERSIFLHNAPHLAKKLKLHTPVYSYFELVYMYFGLFLYKLISGKKSIGKSSFINKTLLSLFQPSIKKMNLKGGISFFDGSFLDSRMVIALLQTAQSFEAICKNYCEVKSFLYENNKIVGVKYFDETINESVSVNAKCIINATGANIDNIRYLDDNTSSNILSLSSGTHIVIDKKFLPSDKGILISKTEDSRIIFILPYLNKCLVGTTDTLCEYSDNPSASKEDIEYLLDHLNESFDIEVKVDDILSSWTGIRPLLKPKKNKSTQQIVREHSIEISKNNLISIAGGKWTTYRKMAEELVDFTIKNNLIEKKDDCKTKKLKVIGSQDSLKKTKILLDSFDISKETKNSLLKLYGNRAIEVLNVSSKYKAFDLIDESLPFIEGEIIYCIKYEFVKKPIDFISRRISLSFIDKEKSLSIVSKVCKIMKVILNWDEEEFERNKKESIKLINLSFNTH